MRNSYQKRQMNGFDLILRCEMINISSYRTLSINKLQIHEFKFLKIINCFLKLSKWSIASYIYFDYQWNVRTLVDTSLSLICSPQEFISFVCSLHFVWLRVHVENAFVPYRILILKVNRPSCRKCSDVQRKNFNREQTLGAIFMPE